MNLSSSESSSSDENAPKPPKRRRYNAGMFKNYETDYRLEYKDARSRYKWDSFGNNNEDTLVTGKVNIYIQKFPLTNSLVKI